MSADYLIEWGRESGVTLWNDAGRLRLLGPRIGVDELLPELAAHFDELLELLDGLQPGEAERTAAAPWPCSCCQ
jgi:hypothetical protein